MTVPLHRARQWLPVLVADLFTGGKSPQPLTVALFARLCACPLRRLRSHLHHVPSGLSCHAAAVPDSCPINIEE